VKRIHNARRKLLKGRYALGDIRIDQMIILKLILQKYFTRVKCFLVAEDRVQCLTFVDVVVKTWFIL